MVKYSLFLSPPPPPQTSKQSFVSHKSGSLQPNLDYYWPQWLLLLIDNLSELMHKEVASNLLYIREHFQIDINRQSLVKTPIKNLKLTYVFTSKDWNINVTRYRHFSLVSLIGITRPP